MWFLLIVKKTSKWREHLFTLDFNQNWIPLYDDARKLVCDVDLVSRVKNDENRFLDNDTGTGCRIQIILGDVVGYDFDECGRFSISSWLIVAQPL